MGKDGKYIRKRDAKQYEEYIWSHYKSRGMMDVWAMLGNKSIGGNFITKEISNREDKKREKKREPKGGRREETIKQENKNEGGKKWN